MTDAESALRLEYDLLFNQVARGFRPVTDALDLLARTPVQDRKPLWDELLFILSQVHPSAEDAAAAVRLSGLRPTYTPCVLLLKDHRNVQVRKIAALPEDEGPKALRLLLALFSVADERRRAASCHNTCSHWWHRDLSDPAVVEAIRAGSF